MTLSPQHNVSKTRFPTVSRGLQVFFIAVTAYFVAFGNLAGLRGPRAAAPKTRSSAADPRAPG